MRRLVTGRWTAVDSAVLAALVLVTVAFVVVRQSQPPTPSWLGDLGGCRTTPLAHVHDPQRLELLATCSTVTGTVTGVDYVAAYDDLKITIRPDAEPASFLDEANQGLLVADVIATDQMAVAAPPVGSQVTVWGSWVRDKATRTTMVLPAYRIEVNQRPSDTSVITGESVEKHGPAPRRELRLSARADPKVVVGGRIDVILEARWLQGRRHRPASQIRLFTEMTTAEGLGVRWKATMTDTRGIAVLHLVAIQAPGPYTLTVYATPSGQPVTATVSLDVSRA